MSKAICLCIFLWFGLVPQILCAADISAVISDLEGGDHLLVSKAGQEKRSAKLGERVFSGELIEVPNDVSARLLFANGIQIFLAENVRFKVAAELIEKKEVPLLDLIYGKIRVLFTEKNDQAEIRFLINAPAVVAGVRGTDFVVDVDDEVSEVHTLEGVVEVGLDRPGFLSGAVDSLKEGRYVSQRRGLRKLAAIQDFNRAEFLKRLGEKHPRLAKLHDRREQTREKMKEKKEKIKKNTRERRRDQNVRERVKDRVIKRRPPPGK